MTCIEPLLLPGEHPKCSATEKDAFGVTTYLISWEWSQSFLNLCSWSHTALIAIRVGTQHSVLYGARYSSTILFARR